MIVCFALFFAFVLACLLAGWSVSWALTGGLLLFWGNGLKCGFTMKQLWDMAWTQCRRSFIVIRIILFIGIITGLWRASGTIAACITYGVSLIRPSLFLVTAFLLCAGMSYILGTSYGVSSTMGVILMTLARSGGVDATVAAGVVLSGVYFGDRCSPASSAAALVAAMTETELYSNVKQMLRTGLLPTVLTIAIYLPLSLRHPLGQVDSSVLTALEDGFFIHWAVLIPALLMLVLPLFRVSLGRALLSSIALSAILAMTAQGYSFGELLRISVLGCHWEDSPLEQVLGGGGIVSMKAACTVVLLTGLLSGILKGNGCLASLGQISERLAKRLGRFPAMVVVSAVCASVLCNQAVTTMLDAQMMGKCYDNREELAMDIENSGILIAGLIPWSIACSVPLAMLGSNAASLPYAALLWLIPLCYGGTKRWFYPKGTES